MNVLILMLLIAGVVWYIRDTKKTGNANPLNPVDGRIDPQPPTETRPFASKQR